MSLDSNNSSFSTMLSRASEQSQPQRLLFMLAQSESDDVIESNDSGGTITPLMCVDKTPDELTNFDAFIKEADSINSNWNMIFIAALDGNNGHAPSSEDAEPILNKMVNDLASGQDLSRYLVLDRAQQLVEISHR